MKEIPLYGRKEVAVIDDADYEAVSKGKWHLAHGYAVGTVNKIALSLHNFIMKPERGQKVDHKDKNRLNCTRENLRICTNAQNSQNRNKCRFGGQSIYKGVFQNKWKNHWYARIMANGENVFIGSFKTEVLAARAYDEKARELHGEFACLNFP
jgi:hypothetical protein